MIVLNGDPFILYNLRSLYPYAHQIIVVEGASKHAAEIASNEGHSTDNTLPELREFQEKEDPENKVIVVTAEDEGYPNGFWPGEKHEQSRAYAKRADGDWLWQVDVDEFYKQEDMEFICSEVLTNPLVMTVSLPQIQFYGGLKWYVDGWYLRYCGGGEFNRIFRWRTNYQYRTHRPPTVINERGQNLRDLGWVRAVTLQKQNIFLYHYSLVFPRQVVQKSNYYQNAEWNDFKEMDHWVENSYLKLKNPYHVHNVYKFPSWLERYKGDHPQAIYNLWDELVNQKTNTDIHFRKTDDIEALLSSSFYIIGKICLKIIGLLYFPVLKVLKFFYKLLPNSIKVASKKLRGV